jgi:ATP-dependent RNA helicase DeaD
MAEPNREPDADSGHDHTELLGPELASALEKKGYTTLTPVQRQVLDPALEGRDLRVSSQTGSGKTLAIGFLLRTALRGFEPAETKLARPKALVIVPTRELAKQVEAELGWLYAPLELRIAAVTGGSSYRDEHRALARGPALVVGTPGRLLDHLNRGAIDASGLEAVVLDEADRMLDLGFRDELEAILGQAPEGHRTHLVSATFAREVTALADRVQTDPVRIEGTPLGSANADIDHVIYLVRPDQRIDALVNVLLFHPEEQTLIFARTRADVADITRELTNAGFATGSLSGEMQQQARLRALDAFKRGEVRALVATDVAARGIDVQDIARVVQVDAPSDAETYVHRSGRTGRAGRKGTSALLVPPSGLRRAVALLSRAGVRHRIEAVPTREAILEAQDQRFLAQLGEETEVSERVQARVAKIVERGLAERALAVLLSRAALGGEPRTITPVSPNVDRRAREARAPARSNGPSAPGRRDAEQWVPFRVTWGEAHGADPRRLVAMLCRRGDIRGTDIGAIEVSRFFSNVEVSARVAAAFARNTSEPDPRDPRVIVTPLRAPRGVSREERGSRPERPPSRPERPRPSHGERPSRPERPRPSHGERPSRPERPERHRPPGAAAKPVKSAKPARKPGAPPVPVKGGQKPPKRRLHTKRA